MGHLLVGDKDMAVSAFATKQRLFSANYISWCIVVRISVRYIQFKAINSLTGIIIADGESI